MGVSDRGYMDGTDESTYGPSSARRYSAPVICIIANALIWVLWQFGRSEPALEQFMFKHFMVSSTGVLQDYYFHTLITSTLSHIDLFHILFNMMFLWFLGEDIERIYGYRNFFVLYVVAGATASLAHVGMSAAAGELAVPALGASGAVMGMAVVGALHDPNRPVMFMGLIPTKMKWLVTIYIVFDLMGISGATKHVDRAMTGGALIAHAAHLGGAFAGLLWWKFDLRVFPSPGRERVGLLYRIKQLFRRKPKLRVVERSIDDEPPREAVAQSAHRARASAGAVIQRTSSSGSVDAETSRRVDELLDKIHRGGMNALTEEERAFLNASSQKYKK